MVNVPPGLLTIIGGRVGRSGLSGRLAPITSAGAAQAVSKASTGHNKFDGRFMFLFVSGPFAISGTAAAGICPSPL